MINLKELYKPKTFQIDGRFKISGSMPDSLSEIYHENTKMHRSDVRAWLASAVPAGLSAMTLKTFFKRSAQSYKRYDGCPSVKLTGSGEESSPGSLWETIERRRSRRDYSTRPIEAGDFSRILRYGYGITGIFTSDGNRVGLRAAPSAGALYPLDIYPLVNNVENIEKGLHHYNVEDHSLECLKSGDFIEEIYPLVQSGNNAWLENAGAILFVTATFKRNQLKYGDRGYRGVLLDAGHVSQNILLSCTAFGYSACLIVACLDDPVNDFLQIDGVEESVLYAISIGKPQEAPKE